MEFVQSLFSPGHGFFFFFYLNFFILYFKKVKFCFSRILFQSEKERKKKKALFIK